MERIYKNIPLERIAWNVETPPDALVMLVENEKVKPCKTIEFGCGAGNYAVYLAGKGFKVTAIDSSPTAIRIAKENAKKKGVQCDFIIADVLGDLKEIEERFDFAFDWELLHHIYPKQRKQYIEKIHRLLNPAGKYLSVCFSMEDPHFGGSGKYRRTDLDTILYFSTENELENLFREYFNLIVLKTITIEDKFANHQAIYAFMEKP